MRQTSPHVLTLLMLIAGAAAAQQARLIDGYENVDGWQTGGQKEVSFDLSSEHVLQGQSALHIHVEIDHKNAESVKEVAYPMGWPSVRKTYDPSIDASSYDFIEFDVYFTSKDGVDPDFALNTTFRGSEEQGIYSGRFIDLRHGKWAHEKLCIRDIPAAKSLGWVSFWLSESTYDDGAVIDFYIDNMRLTKAQDYEAPPEQPVRHVVARSEAATLWMEGSCRKVRRVDEGLPSGDSDPALRLQCAQNETEAVQLVLTPARDEGLGPVSVDIGALSGPDGSTIAAENVTWSEAAHVPAREGLPEGLPDALPGPKPFTVDGSGNWPIWLEVYVPAGTTAGDYSAPVTVRTDSGDMQATLALHVWDFALPVKQSLRSSTTIYGAWGWSDEIKEMFGNPEYWPFLLEQEPTFMEYLARCRLSPSGIGNLPMSWDEDKQQVVIGDTGQFEAYARRYLAMGHHMDHMPVPCFFDRPSFLKAKKGTDEYVARIGEAHRVAAQWLEDKGWLEDCYVYCVDEVVVHKNSTPRDLALLGRVFDAIRAAHPKIRLFGAETPSPLLRGMNVWCINMDCFDTDVLAEQHALGNEVWWYNGYSGPRAGMRIAARAVDHRAIGWLSYKYGIDGYLIWTVNRWQANPWQKPNDREGRPAGVSFLLYPNPDGTFSPSLRIAMLRDGFEDYEYHVLLAGLADRARKEGRAQLAADCEEAIQRADAFILAYDNCPHIKPSFIYESRQALARQIERAMAALAAP